MLTASPPLPPVLYSTNPLIKLHVQQRSRGDVHFVWCSEYFNAKLLPRYEMAAPPSSDPAAIYRTLRDDVARCDRHILKIAALKAGIIARAGEWERDGAITAEDREEIVCLAESEDFTLWKPLLYVIPRTALEPNRVQRVRPADRAGTAREWVIQDLRRPEFDIL